MRCLLRFAVFDRLLTFSAPFPCSTPPRPLFKPIGTFAPLAPPTTLAPLLSITLHVYSAYNHVPSSSLPPSSSHSNALMKDHLVVWKKENPNAEHKEAFKAVAKL